MESSKDTQLGHSGARGSRWLVSHGLWDPEPRVFPNAEKSCAPKREGIMARTTSIVLINLHSIVGKINTVTCTCQEPQTTTTTQ